MRAYFLYFIVFSFIYSNVYSLPPIAEVIHEYFAQNEHNKLRSVWHKFQRGYEISISKAIKDGNSGSVMNVYMSRPRELYMLSKGMYIHDGNVDVVFLRMWLRRMPQLLLPEVIVGLLNHVLYIETVVDKIFIDTNYWLMRNRSSVVYANNPDDKNYSPFSLQQVTEYGDVTLVAENCMLSGSIILLLSGPTVSLGHDTLKLSDCKFNIEISTPGLGAPPVMAPYLDAYKTHELMKFVRRALRQDLRPKIEGILLSYVNISAIFGAETAMKRRMGHKALFRNVWEYHGRVSYYFNKICSEGINGQDSSFPDFKILVEEEAGSPYTIEIKNVKVDGINTLYNGHDGGPYKLKHVYVSESFKFGMITIRADMNVEKTGRSHAVTAYVKDIAIDLTWKIAEENGTSLKDLIDIVPINYRKIDFAIADMDLTEKERMKIEALLAGYLGDHLSSVIKKHLSQYLQQAFEKADIERMGPTTPKPEESKKDECEERFKELAKQKKDNIETTTYAVSPELEHIKAAADKMKGENSLRGLDVIKSNMNKLFNKVVKNDEGREVID